MSLFSSALREAIRKGSAFFVFEWDLGGSTYRYGLNPVNSESLGHYEDRVKNCGMIPREIGLRVGALSSLSTTVTIFDTDGTITALIEGSNAQSILGSVARIKLMAEDVDASDFWTAFTGIIDHYKMTASYEWTFTIGTKDNPLRGNINLPPITDFDFPNARDDAKDTYTQAIYGVHNDNGITAGMVICPVVDTTNYYCLASVGWIDDVTKIYADGSTESPGVASPAYNTDWVYATINGRKYTLLTLPADPGDSLITINCKGLTTDTSGSQDGGTGVLIENPAEQIEHFLSNFVFNAWQTGDWYTPADSSVPISANRYALTAACLDVRSTKGSRVIIGGQTGESVVNEWCAEEQIPAFWTGDGELAAMPDDYIVDDIYFDWPWITEEHILSDISYDYNREILADEIAAKYMFSHSDGSFFRSVRVKDTRRNWDVSENLDIHWNRSSLT